MDSYFPRITNQMMTNSFVADLQRNLANISNLQNQISSGNRIQTPSDDPIGAARSLDYKQVIAQTDQYTKNATDIESSLQTMDGSLGQMTDVLQTARDLALRVSNEATMTQSDRDVIANQIDSAIHSLVQEADQKYEGKYMFAGDTTTTVPFVEQTSLNYTYTGAAAAAGTTAAANMLPSSINGISEAVTNASDIVAIKVNGVNITDGTPGTGDGSFKVLTDGNGNITNNIQITMPSGLALKTGDKIEIQFDKTVAVTYQGNSGVNQVEIGDGIKVGTTFAGAVAQNSGQNSVFGQYSPSAADSQSVEAFQKLIDLRDSIRKYTSAPSTNAQTNILKGIDDIDAISKNIAAVRAEEGNITNRITLAQNRLQNVKINASALLSKVQDTDQASAVTQLVQEQNTYQAALGAGARILQTTLLDYLK